MLGRLVSKWSIHVGFPVRTITYNDVLLRPTPGCHVGHDRLEEIFDVLRVERNKDRPRLEDDIYSVDVAVTRDLFEEGLRRGSEIIFRHLDSVRLAGDDSIMSGWVYARQALLRLHGET